VDFSVVLINFNSGSYIEPCLERLRSQSFSGSVEIIVVNHLSTDGSLEVLKSRSDIKLICPGKNSGYSGGNNLGISQSSGKYVICLNFDCLLEPDFLQIVYDAFEANPQVGMISGKLRKLADMKPTMYLDSTGIDFTTLIPADRGEWQYDNGQYDQQTDVFGPSGAAGCYRREALEDVAYKKSQIFDEQMFIYCEDIDLSWRLNLAGWRGLYLPEALAYHERGVTRRESFWKKVNYYTIGFRNRLFVILKNLRWEDAEGRLRKLVNQELRFFLTWCGKDAARWLVMIYVIFRLLMLMLRPSFIFKRILAHRHKKGSHLNLSLDTDFWDREYQKRIKQPLACKSPDTATGQIAIDFDKWSVSTEGAVNSDAENNGTIGGDLKGISAIKLVVPSDYRETIKNSIMYMDIKLNADLNFQFKAETTDGRTGKSDWFILPRCKGAYAFDFRKMNLAAGMENILSWKSQWENLYLVLTPYRKSKFRINKLYLDSPSQVIN